LLTYLLYSSYDSGSPVIIPGDDTADHPDILVALVSWGVLCADPDYPGVNSRVSDMSDWIDATVCELSENPPADFFCQGSLAPSESPSVHPSVSATPSAFPTTNPKTEWLSSSSRSRVKVILILLLAALVVAVCCVMTTTGMRRCFVHYQNKQHHGGNNKPVPVVTASSSSLGAEQERLRPDTNYDKEESYDSIVGIEVSDK
jgi:hypothetical protein